MGAGFTRRGYLVGSTSAIAGFVASGAIARAGTACTAGRGEGAGLAHSGPLPPSIFIVGDRKQSIYAFRDA